MDKNALELKPKSLSHFIADEIRRRIWEREIDFGERLLEPDLSAEFAVSRGSLREALQILEHEGLVVIKPRKGTFVATFTDKDLHEIYEARLLLEVFAFTNAVPQLKESDIQYLESIKQAMYERHDDKWIELVNLDLEFHSYVVNLCRNERIIKFYKTIQIQIRTFLTRLAEHYVDRKTLYAEHVELLEAIKTKDLPLVEQKVREHIEDGVQRLFGQK